MKDSIRKFALLPILGLVIGLAPASPAGAATPPGKTYLGGEFTAEELERAYVESFPRTLRARGAEPTALPDIFGPGAVLRAGNVVTKVTNIGIVGNPFTGTSNDPSGQWPGQSGIEYMNAIALAVGGVEQVNGQIVRRVTFSTEWRPPSLDNEDKIYAAYEGIVGGVRFSDDDSDGEIDEDFLDGRDNDGDGGIDEDYDAQGQQMYSLVMTDFSPQSLVSNVREQHVPLTVRVEQKTWAYSLTSPNLTNFDVIEYRVKNVSGNSIDSMFVGWLVDFDAGPAVSSNYFQDDQDIPWYPQGWFIYDWTQGGQIRDPRVQLPHSTTIAVHEDSALCQRDTIRINGFSVADDNGDENLTRGVPSFLLFSHTLDPLGLLGPRRVQWRAYRSYTGGTPYGQGGNPSVDIERFEFMSSNQNIATDENDPMVGFITAEAGDQRGDYVAWVSVGPWLSVPNGASISVTVGFAVDTGTLQLGNAYRGAYQSYVNGSDLDRGAYGRFLLDQYPSLNNAFIAQIAYEGIYELNRRFERPDFHGRETGLIAERGQQYTQVEQCGETGRSVLVTDREYYWFDFDCDFCTGIWDWGLGQGAPRDAGYFHKTWNTSSPPPSPVTNASLGYNFTDNPSRPFVPGRDNSVTVAWDNLPEISPDPAPPNKFDFRGYKVWKVADWSRPVGSPGPAEEDWALVAEFRFFNYYAPNGTPVASNRLPVPEPCTRTFREIVNGKELEWTYTAASDTPCVFIPVANSNQLIYLERGDIWNQQTGQVIKPNTALDCRRLANGQCEGQEGCVIPPTRDACQFETRPRYPVGRYAYTDNGVKNGFMYFYSVTAFDSTEVGLTESRRSAVEAEGVVPQASPGVGKSVTVVPNPYRGFANIQQRPSAWDLTPNATDPTGTHIDFYGMPAGRWTLKIYTISGDLVQEIRSDDAVNESIRPPVTIGDETYSGVTRQQDTPNDGQARWNLISRNGQDIVSGVYLFTVDSKEGIQRGKFVVIR